MSDLAFPLKTSEGRKGTAGVKEPFGKNLHKNGFKHTAISLCICNYIDTHQKE